MEVLLYSVSALVPFEIAPKPNQPFAHQQRQSLVEEEAIDSDETTKCVEVLASVFDYLKKTLVGESRSPWVCCLTEKYNEYELELNAEHCLRTVRFHCEYLFFLPVEAAFIAL